MGVNNRKEKSTILRGLEMKWDINEITCKWNTYKKYKFVYTIMFSESSISVW